MLISFWVKNRRSFLNALRWKGILFSKSPSNSIFNCLCYHTPHSFPQSFSWFQSTLPRGERQEWWRARPMTEDISIHASTRGATNIRGKLRTGLVNFNPRSREGSDMKLFGFDFGEYVISIHAPTRGATIQKSYYYNDRIDFNPRSHEGSDLIAWLTNMLWFNFNPRSHEGSDSVRRLYDAQQENFNPRSHEGSDLIYQNRILFHNNFNPRSHEGSDSIIYLFCKFYKYYFNPRSHEGSDVFILFFLSFSLISIHAPTRGAT